MLSRSLPLGYRASCANWMRAVVGVKRCVDYTVKVRVKDNKVVTDNVKMSMNPFDEIAVQEAVNLKNKKIVKEIIAVSIGVKKCEEVLRTAMALGADKAILINCSEADAEKLQVNQLAVAKIFQKLHEELKPDMWFLGKQAIDSDSCATPQLLAGLLDIPQGTFLNKVEVKDNKVTVTREMDAGNQILELTTPCVLCADLRLNTPKFATLPNIMKARKKPLEVRDVAKMGVDLSPRLAVESATEPPTRKAGIKVKDVNELVDKLKNEAKVL